MGKGAAAQQLSKSGLKFMKINRGLTPAGKICLQFEISNWRFQIAFISPPRLLCLRFCFSLCLVCVSAVNIFAQTELDVLAQRINRGNTEQKRDALFQLRNLK